MESVEIIKIVGVALITGITAIILKSTRPELAFALCLTGGIIMMMMVIDSLRETITLFENFAIISGIDNSIIKIILKIIGIGYLVEFGANLVEEFGLKSLADKLIFSGKIAILVVSIPILEGVFGVITSLVKLI